MTLARLLEEIEVSVGAVTTADLARRLGRPLAEVEAMLGALQAGGWLTDDGGSRSGPDSCPEAGSCRRSCPGPGRCPLVVDLGLGVLEPRRH